MTDETPRLLCYNKLASRNLRGAPLWVAITLGSAGKGGDGIVVHGSASGMFTPEGLKIEAELVPGDSFKFSANRDYQSEGVPIGNNVDREVWGVDAAPPEVIAAWMKYQIKGVVR